MSRLVLLLALMLGCSDAESPASSGSGATDAPDLVVLMVTGLRRDASGDDGAETAFLRALGGTPTVRFTNAYAQSPHPFASLGSLFTGRYVGAIPMCGLLLAGDRTHSDEQQAWCARIPETRHTLAEVLGLYGYRTALVTADLVGADRLADGFQHVVTSDGWDAAARDALRWWSESADKPRMLVVVLSDGEGDVLGQTSLPRFPERKYQWIEPVLDDPGRIVLDPAQARAAYASGAAAAGTVLGRVRASLDSERATWIVAGSSNGMSLTERGGFHSGRVPLLTNNILVDRSIRVPLVLFGPDSASTVVEGIVELIDVFPTLAALGGAVAPAGLHGTDLRSPVPGTAYAEFGDMLAVREGAHLLTFRCTQHNATSIDPGITKALLDPQTAGPPDFFSMYDVALDPMQRTNLRQTDPKRFRTLRSRLIDLRTSAAAVPEEAMNPERLWALRMAPSDGYW